MRCLCTAKQLLANAAFSVISCHVLAGLAPGSVLRWRGLACQGSEGVGVCVVCRREKSPQYFVITPKLVRSPRRHCPPLQLTLNLSCGIVDVDGDLFTCHQSIMLI